METLPMPLDALGASPGGLDEFRITAAREIATLLGQLCDGNVPISLNAADGTVVRATIWSMDAEHGRIGFAVDPLAPALDGLLAGRDAVAVGYLDNVKVQFDTQHLVLVRGPNASVLSGPYPRELFRVQRRSAYRVRPLLRSSPMARVRHTDIAEMQLTLRVLDISVDGCALFLPDDVPPLQVGGVINGGVIELDADTRFQVDLRLQHVTSLGGDARGVRLGCEFVRPDAGAQRALQRFIDHAQKRAKMLALN
jgi:c-di-GMP-binding flagellar brake protein YcgR